MSIEQNIENLEIRNANVVTFVGSSSTIVDTISGRIQCKGFQHNSNVITDISGPHGRVAPTLKKYPEIIFADGKFDRNDTTNTYVQAGYTVTDSSHHNEYYGAWIFDDQTGFVTNKNLWISPINTYTTSGGAGTPTMTTSDARCTTVSGVATPGEWVQLKLPNKVKLSSISIMGPTDGNQSSGDLGRSPKDAVLAGSVDGTTWNSVLTWSGVTDWALKTYKSFPANVDSTNYYNYFRLIVTKNDGTQVYASIQELQLYGYEEDPPAGDHSVDTTFKSRFNNPQLTGVQVFVDGKGSGSNQISGGPDVTGTTTYNESGKHWELNGQLTSNITMEANTFLEGDQPHAVSVWFNSSNLEANVSNTCVFSVSDQEKLDSVNLDLQSNTWHNLTYAYQGEGGSRVTYLDGRKVAEDQAEDTFGDYPPFAMTGYSQGGYVVSASSEIAGSNPGYAYRAFDNNTNPDDPYRWVCADTKYNTDGSYGGTESHTDVDGNVERGEWLKIELPHKLKVGYFEIAPYPTNGSQSLRNYAILGSNDDINWYQVQKVSGLAAGNGLTAGSVVPTGTYKNSTFKYFVFIWGNKAADANRHVAMGELKLYGHRENDLVRLPDPTNVLKYPHIEFPIGSNSNDPASIRGYVVSGSSSSNSGIGRRPWSAFNDLGEGTANLGGVWQNLEDGSNHKYTPQTTGLATTNAALFEGVRGEWIKLELPRKLKVSQVYILTGAAHEGVEKAILYGSNDDTIWDVIKDSGTAGTGFTFTLTANGGLKEATESVTTSNYYKYLLLQVTEVVVGSGSTDGRSLQLYKLRYYGTEEATSIPIQIGGGNIDKVANFRVYDKFVGEDQALEIWDAQKDEFGRAKPQMVLQQGKLGIGTDAPQGSLSVADEPHVPEEFPPRAMTADKTYIEGHGEFCTSVTEIYPNAYAYKAFNKIQSGSNLDFHWSANTADYDNVTGVYTGSSDYFTNVEGQIALGHWIQIEFPYKINYRYSEIQGPDHAAGRQPHTGYIVGSNDLSGVWTSLHNYSGMTRTGVRDFVTYTPPTISTQSFKYFRLVIEKMGGNTTAGVSQWHIFGTREQGQSVLHDGQLTLTKSLNVPRIGPALDADDTPRRDRLVVEYNTSTSQATGTDPTFGGVVRDTSGRGNDGVYYRRAAAANTTGGYNATEKAFEFSTQYTPEQHLRTRINNRSGDYTHSASIWFKTHKTTSTISTNEETLFHIGNDFTAGVNIYASFYGDNLYYGWHTHNIYAATTDINQLGWNHVCVTYTGGGSTTTSRKIYLNGKVQSATLSGTSGTLLNLPKDTFVTLGGKTRPTDTIHHLDGFLSNFKLYDTALTAEEVKTLYDMGRCDEGHHVVNFSKTRVGIGLGDGEAPRGALDVKDEAVFSSILCQASPEDLKNDVESKGVHEVLLTFEGKKTTTDNKIHEGIQFKHYSSHQTGYRGITWQSSSDHNSSQPDFLMGGVTMAVGGSYNSCSVNFHAAASKVNGETRRAYINSGNNGNRITTFTGQHRCVLHDISLNNIESYEGMIVSANKNQYMNVNGTISRGSNAITINESIPIVTMSNIEKDKKCFGVISTSEDTETREEQHGNLTSLIEKEKGDTRVYINSIGEGAIWVSNIGGNLESGDYITTSNVAGYGQKQDGAGLMNYTVAKITMDCDFEPATQPIQQILRSNVIQTYYLGDVHKVKTVPHEFVTTVVGANDTWSNVSIKPSDVTYAEWSNLEANTQNTYTLTYTQTSNVVYDTKYTLTTTANVTESDAWDRVSIDPPDVTYAQYSNLEANTQSSYSLTFTKTTTDEKTTEEWSALESNTQSLYNMVYYQSVEEEVASDYPGATTHTRVTDVIENELDEHGQIQWEDHATETEKAYKVRFLAADGTQTDEANAVHIAAFVGCTYHCG